MSNEYNFVARAAVLALTLSAAFAVNTSLRAQAPPGSLWYNGDFNGVNGHTNGVNTSDPNGAVWGEFDVTSSVWIINAVFSDNLLSTVVTGADWEIRSGCPTCTLIDSGTTNAPVVTPTGRSGFGYTEYMVEVTGLNFTLAPGTYWINVLPIGNGTGHSFNTTTSGANCVGMPCGNGMSYLLPEDMFTSTNFSMGVIGTVVPEPETWALLACGSGGLLIVLRWRRSFQSKARRILRP